MALERPDPASSSSTRAGGHHRRSPTPSPGPRYRSARVVVPAPGLAVLPCHELADVDDREVGVNAAEAGDVWPRHGGWGQRRRSGELISCFLPESAVLAQFVTVTKGQPNKSSNGFHC